MKKYIFMFLFIQSFLMMFIFAEERINSVRDIDVRIEDENIIIRVKMDFSPTYKYFSLESGEFPFKVAVDIKDAKLATLNRISVNKEPVKQIRLSQWYTNPDIVRFVIDFTEKVDYEIESSEDYITVIVPYKHKIEKETKSLDVSNESRMVQKPSKDIVELESTEQEMKTEQDDTDKPEHSEAETVKELIITEDMAEQRIEMMNYKNISIIDLLRVFSELYTVNIVISKEVLEEDLITVRLQDVPLKGALEAILTANGYNYVRKNDIILVKNRETELIEDLETEIFHLNYINAGDIIENLRNIITADRGNVEMFVKSPVGEVGVALPAMAGGISGGAAAVPPAAGAAVSRSDVLIVTDYPEIIEKIKKIIKEVDVAPKQVRIEVKLIETKLDDRDKMGINWTATAEVVGKGGIPSGARQQGGGAGGTGEEATTEGEPGMQIPGKPLFVNKFHFGTLSFSQMRALLEMLEQKGNSKLLNQPSISVLDNQQADIAVGTIIPIEVYQPLMGAGGAGGGGQQQQGMIGGTTVQQQFVSIALTVIPHVNLDRYITLWIKPNISEITGYTGKYNDLPITSTRTANSTVRVKDGDTVIIGGLIKEDKIKTTRRVKFLSDIPLFGNLFIYNSIETTKSELIILITPYIIRDEDFAIESSTNGD